MITHNSAFLKKYNTNSGQKLVEELNCTFIDYNDTIFMQLPAKSEKRLKLVITLSRCPSLKNNDAIKRP